MRALFWDIFQAVSRTLDKTTTATPSSEKYGSVVTDVFVVVLVVLL